MHIDWASAQLQSLSRKSASDLMYFQTTLLLYRLNQNKGLYKSTFDRNGKIRSKCPHRSNYQLVSNSICQSYGERIYTQLLQFRFSRLLMFFEKYFLSCRCSNFNLSFFWDFSNAFCVMYSKPIIFRVSVKSVCLMRRSMGEDELRDGQTLTSISHGFSLESTKMSKPQSSKPQPRLYWVLEWMSNITGSAEIIVLMITSLMEANTCLESIPLSSQNFLNAVSDHLEPSPSFSALEFLTNFLECLLTLKLVKCINLLEMSFTLVVYSQVANRVSPSSNIQILRGSQLVTNIYILRSYLKLLMRCGLAMYQETSISFLLRTELYLLIILIPRPHA